VLAKPGRELTLEELVRFLRDERNISAYKLPERLELVASFPMTQVGKIDKKELRRTISEKLNSEAQDKG
jgi:2,3-dihydroxybenzoate-AMP ligase